MKTQLIAEKCIVCGAPAVTYKWSIIGQMQLWLCDEHKDAVPYLSFGPQLFENASMGVIVTENNQQLTDKPHITDVVKDQVMDAMLIHTTEYQEIGYGEGRSIRRWTNIEKDLAAQVLFWRSLCEQLADIPDGRLHEIYNVAAKIRQAVHSARSRQDD